MSEGDISRNARAALASLGIPSERLQSGTAKGGKMHLCSTGTPDILTPYGLVEMKKPGETPEPHQLAWHAKWRKHGMNVDWADSVEKCVRIVLAWRADARHPLLCDCSRCLNGDTK